MKPVPLSWLGFTLVFTCAAPAIAKGPTVTECLAANEHSLSLREDRHLRAARDALLICAAKQWPSDVRKECIRGVDELNQSIPTLVFEARDPQGNDLAAV